MMSAMVSLFQRFGQSFGTGFVLLLAVGAASAQESCHVESLGTAKVVAVRDGGRDCAGGSLKLEQMARNGHLGLGADPNFAPLTAENPAQITARRGQFTLVGDKVLSARESGSTVYVNFGYRWARDFTVTILRRNQRMFTAAGVEPKKLEAKRIRVREWIDQRRDPIIEAAHPEQIEIVD
jgi:hypothetical protein